MNENELKRKLESGETLSSLELALLDAFLEEGSQSVAANAVRNLEQSEPSMAWRSKLNERLVAATAKKRPFWKSLTFPLAAGTATVAAGLVVFFFITDSNGGAMASLNKEELTAVLLEWHEEAKTSSAMPSDGIDLEGFTSAMQNNGGANNADEILYGGDALHTL